MKEISIILICYTLIFINNCVNDNPTSTTETCNSNYKRINFYDSAGNLSGYQSLSWDANGNIARRLEHNLSGKIIVESITLYSDDNQIINTTTTVNADSSLGIDSSIYCANYSYDENNNLLIVRDCNSPSVHKFFYDSTGQKIKEVFADDSVFVDSGFFISTKTLDYDANGNNIKITYWEIHAPNDSSIDDSIILEYDPAGNVTKIKYYSESSNGLFTLDEKTNNENGKEIESRSYDTQGVLTSSKKTSYNSCGDISNDSTFNGNGELLWYEEYLY